eukprot:10732746-Prorocentrum_lima.AAC.1
MASPSRFQGMCSDTIVLQDLFSKLVAGGVSSDVTARGITIFADAPHAAEHTQVLEFLANCGLFSAVCAAR